jgi:hypothetical protein
MGLKTARQIEIIFLVVDIVKNVPVYVFRLKYPVCPVQIPGPHLGQHFHRPEGAPF